MSHNKQLLSNSIEHQNIKFFILVPRKDVDAMLGLGLAFYQGMDNDTIFSLKR